MQVLDEHTKFAHLGKPGTAFSKGFARRLEMITRLVDLQDKVILDDGCGEGVWFQQFMRYTSPANVYGSDFDPENIRLIQSQSWGLGPDNLKACPAEQLEFPDSFFDIVFSNEVLEHVQDDRKAVEEAVRVLKPGGNFIVFTPNRGWPFEQHGMFLNGKYYWGNIPLLPWMPAAIRKKFAPHVRNYSNGDIRKLFAGLPVKVVHHSHIFSGFDGMVRRFGVIGLAAQKLFHVIEKTPLHFFGISHFVVIQKL